jgi:hypothetical protein
MKPRPAYLSPSSTLLRFEAVWAVTIGQRRSHNKMVSRLMKLFKPKLEKYAYAPSSPSFAGYQASLLRCGMEEADIDGEWPCW